MEIFHIRSLTLCMKVVSLQWSRYVGTYLLSMKTSLAVGDVAFCIIASSIISFMPSPNMFDVCFDGKQPTTYKMLSVINYFADLSAHLSSYKFNVCDNNGSCILTKEKKPRSCCHTVTRKSCFYYMSIRERMVCLLNSDLKNMFLYPKYKYRSPKVFISLISFHFFSIISSFFYDYENVIIIIGRNITLMMLWTHQSIKL